MPPHSLTNSKMQKYYENRPIFNGVYSRNNLLKIKDGPYVINPDEYKWIGPHWITLYVGVSHNVIASYDATCFNSFGVEHIPNEIKRFIEIRNITANIFRTEEYH